MESETDVLYDGRTRQEWIEELSLQSEWNARHALALLACFGFPRSLLDIGCGDGSWVKAFRSQGIRAYGVDQLVPAFAPDFYQEWNLVRKFSFPETVNMVLCLEVAEHLHESAHATLCDTLCDNLAEGRGNYLVFSSAHPGQGGSVHIAERPAPYWHEQFSLRRLSYRDDLTCRLQLAWANLKSPLWWLAANVMVFEK